MLKYSKITVCEHTTHRDGVKATFKKKCIKDYLKSIFRMPNECLKLYFDYWPNFKRCVGCNLTKQVQIAIKRYFIDTKLPQLTMGSKLTVSLLLDFYLLYFFTRYFSIVLMKGLAGDIQSLQKLSFRLSYLDQFQA